MGNEFLYTEGVFLEEEWEATPIAVRYFIKRKKGKGKGLKEEERTSWKATVIEIHKGASYLSWAV